MNGVLFAAVANAALAVPLAAAALAAERLLNRPALTHALWVLVLLKLVTPPVLEVPMIPPQLASVWHPDEAVHADAPDPRPTPAIPVQPPEPAGRLATAASLTTPPAEPAPEVSSPSTLPATAPPGPATSQVTASAQNPVPEVPPVPRPPARSVDLVAVAWIVGMVVASAVQLRRFLRFRRFLRRAEPAPGLDALAADLGTGMGLRRSPRVLLLPGVVSPMLWGLGRRSTVLFPARLAERLDSDRLGSLLAHELAHFGRGDQWVRLLELAAGVLYWWHPAVWLARRGIEAAGEDCADAWALECLGDRPRCYASALLDAVDFLAAGPSAVVPGVTGLGTAAALRRRLTRIMQGPCPRALSRPGRAAVLLLLLILPLQPALFELAGSQTVASAGVRFADDLPEPPPVDAAEIRAAFEPPAGRLPEPLSPLPGDHVWASATSRDGRYSLDVRLEGAAAVRDLGSGLATPLPSAPRAADFSPDGRTLAFADGDGRVSLWDLAAGRVRAELRPRGAAVRSLAYSPTGDRIAVGGDDGVLLRPQDGSAVVTLPPAGGPVAFVRFSADGGSLVAIAGDWASSTGGRVSVWDGEAWAPAAVGFRAAVAEFTSDGLVVAAWDGRIAYYHLESPVPFATARVAKDLVSAASFCPAAGLAGLPFSPDRSELVARDVRADAAFATVGVGANAAGGEASRLPGSAGRDDGVELWERSVGTWFRSSDVDTVLR